MKNTNKSTLPFLLITAIITACSSNVNPVITTDKTSNSTANISKNQETILSKEEYSQLEKEYGQFKTESFSQAYLKKKLDKWKEMGTQGDTGLAREIEFARLKHAPLYCTVMAESSNGLKSYIELNTAVLVAQAKQASLATFLAAGCTPLIPADLVSVSGGTFQMGAVGVAEPVHSVTLGNFYIGKYEVKQSEWTSVYNAAPTDYGSSHLNYKTLMHSTATPSDYTGTNLPVERVSWFDAIAYCNARSIAENFPVAYDTTTGELLNGTGIQGTGSSAAIGSVTTDTQQVKGYRLPTEAEWEFAARGGNGNTTNGNIYSGSNTVGDVAWYSVNSDSTTHVAGTKAANELGLYDMSGNVFEWSQDWDGSYTADTTSGTPNNPGGINPIGATTGSSRIMRGGSFIHGEGSQGSSLRNIFSPVSRNGILGFRVVRSAN